MYHPAGMRRAGPILILLIGVFALVVAFFPGLKLPDPGSADGQWRLIETKLGLDLEGGLRVEYQALPKDGQSPTEELMGVIKDIIERRVNQEGVSEAVVVVQGSDRVVVELPGVTDVDSVRRLVGQTGRLDFVPLGSTQATTGQILDLEANPPLFSGDQVESAAVGTDPERRRPRGRLRAPLRRRPEVRGLHAGPYRRVLRDRPRRGGHLGARSSGTRSRTDRSRSAPAGSAGSRPTRPETSSRSSSSAPCRSRSRRSRASRSQQRLARRS